MIHQGFGENVSIIGTRNGMRWFWQSSTNWRGRRTFDVIGKRDPLLKRRGALGWLSRCCTDEPAHTHTHTHTYRVCTLFACLYFPFKYQKKENQWHRNFSRVPFGFVGVHGRELMWSSECALAKEAQHGKTDGVNESFGSYLVGFL